MKKPSLQLITSTTAMLTMALLLGTTSCKKDDDSTPTESTPANQEGSTTPEFNDGNGALVAVQSKTTTSTPIGPVQTTLGTAVAVFYDSPGGSFIDAGAVSAEGESLSINANNSYTFTPSATNATGIDFSNDVTWDVAGSGNIPAINETITMGFPVVSEINSDETVTKADGYTLSTSSVLNADSVIFLVGDVVRTVPGNATSYSFTSTELSGLNAGTSIAQIAAYLVDERTVDGKKFYFVNETVVSQNVTIE